MINGLDLFSGYGGLTLALAPWVRPLAYCEIDRYAQSILLSRMADGSLPGAPIWDDIRTLNGKPWRGIIDIIYGGFPCTDISVAGAGKGLEGKQSGLFFEMLRLAEEIRPAFIFAENVPAIRTRGLERVVREFSGRGYDCRWGMLSAQEVGAPHRRQRWFMLAADAQRSDLWDLEQRLSGGWAREVSDQGQTLAGDDGQARSLAHAIGSGLEGRGRPAELADAQQAGRWAAEPGVCRVAHGCAHRVDRIRALGNGVVPLQAQEAFNSLISIGLTKMS